MPSAASAVPARPSAPPSAPQSAPRPRLAIFGDSHYACVRLAHGRGLVSLDGWEVEYWGHVGKRFRHLGYRDGAIVPLDDFTAERFAKFNERGRRCLPVADFDAVLFVGCRLYVTHLLFMAAQARADGDFLSTGLMERLVRDTFATSVTWGFARRFAEAGRARILFSPPSLPTAGLPHGWEATFPDVAAARDEDRARLWDCLVRLAAVDGVTFLPQPDHTVAGGAMTHPDYGVENHLLTGDMEHKNPAYGSAVLIAALAVLAQRDGP
ncbi:MAG: hypothetical protein JSS08_02360 [Proteobacteria bacterium]|nr:hypothetical protein [Pseudomonadota bacterium]